MEKSTESKRRLRAPYLSLCLTLMALCLLATIHIPYSIQAKVWRAAAGEGWENTFVAHDAEDFSHRQPRLGFPRPLQAVSDLQTLNQPVQVGAWGDEASVGNSGVQVEIQTNTYNVSSQGNDAFWVGDVLSDGSFVQFGYLILSPGYYCLKGDVAENGTSCLGASDNVGFSDARWFWAYFPNVRAVGNWYYGFGSANSAGSNGTWHLYSILPSASGEWRFSMDGVTIYSSNFPYATSTSPAHLVAEKASGPYLSHLGPVEFRGLAYLGDDYLWHATSSLALIDGCGSADSNLCSVSSAYGVESAGPNDVIAGSSVLMPDPRQPVWERQSTCTLGTKLLTLGTIGSAPLNVTLIDSVSSPQGSFRIDWWFGDGSHQAGSPNRTVTYRIPGNYTPLVRVLDSTGCLSEASGEVSVAVANSSTFGTAMSSFGVVTLCSISPRDTYAPSE